MLSKLIAIVSLTSTVRYLFCEIPSEEKKKRKVISKKILSRFFGISFEKLDFKSPEYFCEG